MPKYLITWNAGYGESHKVEECENQAEADDCAYHEWKEEVESNAEYEARILTPDLAEEYGEEDELEATPAGER